MRCRRESLVLIAALVALSWVRPGPAPAQTVPAAEALSPEVTRLLGSEVHYERLSGLRQIAGLKSVPAAALPLLEQGLRDEDESVRLTAAAALAGMRSAAPEAAGVAAEALQDASPLVRQFAVRAATCLGTATAASARVLRSAAQDPDPVVRGLATGGLERLEGLGSGLQGVGTGPSGEAVGAGGAAGGSEGGGANGDGQRPGGRTGQAGLSPVEGAAPEPDMTSVPALIAALRHPSPEIRLRAAQALGDMGTRALPALPALERARADSDVRVRQKAEWAIAQIWRPARATSDQPPTAPPAGRIFFLTDIVVGCDENGPELQTDLSVSSPGSTADLFGFASLSYLDLAELARCRADARKRGLPADAPLNELCSQDPDWETVAPKFPFFQPYLKDHVIAITCNGQTRFRHLRYDSAGVLHCWGGGSHYALTIGRHKVLVQVFTCEGFRLRFEFEVSFERDGGIPAHLAAYRGPADIGVSTRQIIRELEEEDKPIGALIADLSAADAAKRSWAARKLGRYGVEATSARGALEALTRDQDRGVVQSAEQALAAIDAKSPPDPGLAEFRKERAGRWASLAGALWDAVCDLVGYADHDADDVAPYLAEAAAALRTAHGLYPRGVANNATIGELGYGMGVVNDGRLWPAAMEGMALYEEALTEVPVTSTSFWDRQLWGGWASAWHNLAAAAITYRNDVARFWAFESRWLARAGSLVDTASSRPLELPGSRDPDAWPQPGWWRAEWNDILPPEPEEPASPAGEPPVQVADEGAERDRLLSELSETLDKVSESRALEERWLGGLWDALVAAETKKAEALGLLRAQAEMARQVRARMGYLRGYLAKQPDPESANYWEAAFRLAMDTWNDGWGPRPRVEDMGREAIGEQIRRLAAQHEELLREQDRLINDVLGTYYDGVLLEIEAKGPKSAWEQTRKAAETAYTDAQRARALAKAQLYSASGQGERFREAAREAIASGVEEAQVRYLEAVHFHMRGDVRHALHGYRKVMELTSPGGDAEEALTGSEARWLAEDGPAIGDRARGMAWMLEHAYLDRIDEKATGEAASLRTELDDRLAKGGDKGWLSSVIAHLKIGVVSSLGAIVMQEDGAIVGGRENALETLASSYQNDVAAQHCGILLLRSFHERGVPLGGLDKLSNDEMLILMGELYPGAGDKVSADDALRMRAAIRAAYNNPDVKRLLDVPKQMLDVDTGTPYFDKSDYQETALEWWGDAINVWNVATMLAPMSTYTVGGKVAWFPRWGWIGKTGPASEVIVTAKEAFAAATGLTRLPQLLSQSPAGQKVLQQFSQFFARSTWLEDRALDLSIQLAAGKTGEAIGGTIGVLKGTDGRTEAEAGRMLAELFTAWGAGDVDVMKQCMAQHGITPEHLRTLIQASEQAAASAQEAAELGAGHAQSLRRALDAVPEGGTLTGEARAALQSTGDDIKRMLDEASEQFRKGEASAGWRKLEELRIAREAFAAAEAGLTPEARAWQELLDKRVADWGGCASRSSAQAASLRQVGAAGPKPTTGILVDFHGQDNLAGDLKRLVLQGEWDDAVAGYNQRLAVLRQLGATEARPVQRMALEAKKAEAIAAARARFSPGALVPEGPQSELAAQKMRAALDEDAIRARQGIEALDNDPHTVLKRQARPGETPTYSDPYWVEYADGPKPERVSVFKGSGKDFPDHYDLRSEQVYATIGRECGLDVPECAIGRMTIEGTQREGLLVRFVDGTKLSDLPPEVAIALKQQIARDKVIAALLGDHDRHLGNYLVTADGRVWSIDHGMADVAGRNLGEASPLANSGDFADAMRRRVLDGTRGNWKLEWFDQHFTIEDMLPTIEKAERLCQDPARLRELLSKHLSGVELDDAMRVIPERAKVLRDVMRDCFGSVDDPVVVAPAVAPTSVEAPWGARSLPMAA